MKIGLTDFDFRFTENVLGGTEFSFLVTLKGCQVPVDKSIYMSRWLRNFTLGGTEILFC